MIEKIKITNFGKRHFEKNASGTKITDKTPEEFEAHINGILSDYEPDATGPQSYKLKIIDGYAPFCKLIVIENKFTWNAYFTNAKIGSMPIDISNYQYLRHGYSARVERELPVLSRWFELPIAAPLAEYLIIILYSKEQLKKEHDADIKKKFDDYEKKKGKTVSDSDRKAMSEIEGFGFEFEKTDFEWGVVAILGQSHPGEEPMQPITMMRNSLGVAEGGSGVPLDREKYIESVDFWSKNAIIKS